MSRLLFKLQSFLTRLLELAVIVGMACLTLDVLWGVFSRYVLGAQSAWTDPLATTLLIWVSFLGGALAYGDRAHLGLDYFVDKLAPQAQKAAHAMTRLVVLAFALVVMAYGGTLLVVDRLASGQVVQGLGMLRGYTYIAVPVSGAFIAMFAVSQLVAELNTVSSPTEQRDGS